MGLCMGTRVTIHNRIPYNIPNKQYDRVVREKDDDVINEVMYWNAIPARAPFKK